MRLSLASLAALAAGIVIWTLSNAAGDVNEPWDSSSFLLFYGMACFISMALGALAERAAYVTGAIVIFAMFPVMLVTNGELGALFAVGLFFLAILAVPTMLAAQLGAVLRKSLSGDLEE